MKAMIYAAGLGTRLRPMTDKKPKALLEVAGTPMLGRLIERLKSFDIDQVIINTHHFPGQIRDYIRGNNNFGIEIVISEEKEDLLETGGGLARASWFLDGDEPLLLHNVDILSDIDLAAMLQFHLSQKPIATLAVRRRNSSRYLLFNEQFRLNGWINENTHETILVDNPSVPLQKLAFSGIHILSPAIFKYFREIKPIRIINRYLEIAGEEYILGFGHPDGYWIDMGTTEGIKKAGELLNSMN